VEDDGSSEGVVTPPLPPEAGQTVQMPGGEWLMTDGYGGYVRCVAPAAGSDMGGP
jgi:hypothetical protein